MIPFLKRIYVAFFYDEAAFQRWSLVAISFILTTLASGGTIPVPGSPTPITIPFAEYVSPLAKWASAALVAFVAGKGLPTKHEAQAVLDAKKEETQP